MAFKIILIFVLLAILAVFVIILYKGKITFRYEKVVTNINKRDEVEIEIAKANLEELKKYNENAAKNAQNNSQTLQTITAAAQAFMGVNEDEDHRN